jgi:hypothetical protein
MCKKMIEAGVAFIDSEIRADSMDPTQNCDVIVKGLSTWDRQRWRALGERIAPTRPDIPRPHELAEGVMAEYNNRHQKNLEQRLRVRR